jgi:hypothetical protein
MGSFSIAHPSIIIDPRLKTAHLKGGGFRPYLQTITEYIDIDLDTAEKLPTLMKGMAVVEANGGIYIGSDHGFIPTDAKSEDDAGSLAIWVLRWSEDGWPIIDKNEKVSF